MSRPIEHSGIVERVEADVVRVRIIAHAACSACRAREACGMGESQEKVVGVSTPDASRFAPGERVVVCIAQNTGLKAVLLAYVGALFVLIAALVAALKLFGAGEGAAVLAGLGALVFYYLLLWLFRGSIERKIHFTITKQ